MKVYILMSNYFDGCDFWESIVGVYSNQDSASLAQFELEYACRNADRQSWFIRTEEVIE